MASLPVQLTASQAKQLCWHKPRAGSEHPKRMLGIDVRHDARCPPVSLARSSWILLDAFSRNLRATAAHGIEGGQFSPAPRQARDASACGQRGFRPDVWRVRLIARVPRLILFPCTGRLLPFLLARWWLRTFADLNYPIVDVCQKVGEVAQDKFATRNPQLSMRHPNSRSLSAEYFIGLFKPTRRFAYLRLSMRLALQRSALASAQRWLWPKLRAKTQSWAIPHTVMGALCCLITSANPSRRAGPARSRPASAGSKSTGGHAASHATRAWRCD